MTKRIISFVVCIALFVSCLAVGAIMSKTATEPETKADLVADGANNGAAFEIISGGTQVSGELYVKDGVYYLNDNVTITRENAANNLTYQALLETFEVTAASETHKELNGNGNTITTEVPLFK